MTSSEPTGLRGCFVTGTDTGVGKTVVTAAIVARLRADGSPVRVLKPLLTGLDDPPDPVWAADHVLLASVAGSDPAATILAGFGPAVSPHLAAELAGVTTPAPEQLATAILEVAAPGEALVVEGVGGLLVPLGPDGDVRDLAAALGLPVIVVARPGLGTINHTLLTLEAARARGLHVAGVVINQWPPDLDVMTRSNRDTIERLGRVEVATLGTIAAPEPAMLAAAAAELPVDRWLSPEASGPGPRGRRWGGGRTGP